MPDIIDEIDRLEREATPGPWKADWRDTNHYEITAGPGERYWIVEDQDAHGPDLDLIVALRNNWPALRDRLRKAKAFDAVARGDVGIGCRPNSNDTMKRDWVAYQLTPPRRCSNDLLTAIEAAIAAGKETT